MQTLTADPRYGHHPAGVSPDGRTLAFTSNRRNGVDFDVWLHDLETGEQRLLYGEGGWCRPASGWSPDGRWLSVLKAGDRPLDQRLLLLDPATGAVTEIDPHAEEAAHVQAPAWLSATALVTATSFGHDTEAVVRFDLVTGERTVLVADGYDHEVATSKDGKTLLVLTNEDGATTARFVDPVTGAGAEELPLPEPGVLGMAFNIRGPLIADGGTVFFTFTSPVRPPGIWRHDRGAGESTRLTPAPAADPDQLIAPTRHRVTSFDGEELSVYLYRPEGENLPVLLQIHGGPESQSMLMWSIYAQMFAAAGIAVAVPNVRGSYGYGKRFAGLDDTVKRLDSVADLRAIHEWLPTVDLDPTRAGLIGGSYGGYMTLAGCAFQPDLWAVGVDIVGMSNLVTFLEHTSPYRRAHREREYGSLAHDREFLTRASPLTRVDDIKAPLLVIHGANDPRVPLAETEQLVESLRARGVKVEMRIYPDEGHGLAKRANKADAHPRMLSFVLDALCP
jgi:dipeptidyl aminopeptidase/acylaminoacyl peptidase